MPRTAAPWLFLLVLLFGILVGALGHALLEPPAAPDSSAPVPVAATGPAAPERTGTEVAGSGRGAPDPGAGQRQPVEASARASGPDPELGVIVFGSVRDETGTPVDDAMINFTSPDTGGARLAAQATKGGFSLHGLRPGRWETLVRSRGFEDTRDEVTVQEVAQQRIDLVVRRAWRVVVRVRTGSGQPLAEAMAAAKIPGLSRAVLNAVATRTALSSLPMTELRYHSRFDIGKWDARMGHPGRDDMPDDPDVIGVLQLAPDAPAFVSLVQRHHVLASKPLVPGQKEVAFTVELDQILGNTANVRVRVIHRITREPITGARVAISDRQSGGGGIATGADGVVVLQHQNSGLMEMNIHAKDMESYYVKLRLPTGDVDLGTVELGPPVETTVLVVDGTGAPQQASLSWTNLDRRTFPQPLVSSRVASSDSKGLGKLWGVGAGRYLVQATTKTALATRIVDTANPGGSPIRMELQPSWPVSLDNTGMSPRRILTALIRDEQGRLVYGRYLHVASRFDTRLPAGRYTFEIFDGLKETQAGSFQVAAGGSATVRVTG